MREFVQQLAEAPLSCPTLTTFARSSNSAPDRVVIIPCPLTENLPPLGTEPRNRRNTSNNPLTDRYYEPCLH